jgi:hypothetical protein
VLGDGFGLGETVGVGHGTGPFGPDTRQLALGDGPGVGVAVGVGHGDDPPAGPETTHVALGDGPGVGVAVGVGQGEIVPPLPIRHDGTGVGPTNDAPLTRPCEPSGNAPPLPLPPPPPHAAVSAKIPRTIPSLRMPTPSTSRSVQ